MPAGSCGLWAFCGVSLNHFAGAFKAVFFLTLRNDVQPEANFQSLSTKT